MKTQSNVTTRRRMHRRLVVEELERRIAPAGDVTAFVKGGSLFITGDDGIHDIEIDQAGLNTDQFRISSGVNPTTINGDGVPVVLGGITGNLKINLVLANAFDRVKISDVVAPNDVTANLGEGTNEIEIADTDIVRGLLIKGGGGQDSVLLHGDTMTRQTKLLLGNGNNTVSIQTSTSPGVLVKGGINDDTVSFDTFQVHRDTKLLLGHGNNTVTLSMAFIIIDGHLIIQCGDNDDTVALLSVAVLDNTKVALGDGNNTLTMSPFGSPGSLVISGGDGIDDVTMTDFNVGPARINLGEGDNSLRTCLNASATNNRFNGNTALTVTAADGADDVRIEDTDILGRTKINLGDGDNSLAIPLVTNICILRGFSFQLGGGHDSVTLESIDCPWEKGTIQTGDGDDSVLLAGASVGPSLLINTGSGSDTVDIQQNTTIWGDLSLKTGDNADIVFLDDSTFHGDVTISAAAGNDWIGVERFDVSGVRSTFNGDFVLRAADGDDDIRVGIDGSNVNAADFHGLCILNGGAGLLDLLDMGINLGTLNGNTFALGYTLAGIEIIAT